MRRSHDSLIGAMRAQQTNLHNSLHDPLTKLANRTLLRETLQRRLSRANVRAETSAIAVLCLDLDGFKGVNDRYGHPAGDAVLTHVAAILLKVVRDGDLACRMGGDEYVVLLGSNGWERVPQVAQSIIDAVKAPFEIGQVGFARIGVSIGAAIAAEPHIDPDALIARADSALLVAKRSGKGRVQIADARATATDHQIPALAYMSA